MEKLVLPKEKFNEWINKIIPAYQVFAPCDNDGITIFQRITSPSEMRLTFSNSTVPPKALLFQQTETLFKFTQGKNITVTPSDTPDTKTVILGIRPCDAKSLAILDHVFKGDYEDPYYLTKRKNTVLVGLSCTQPEVNCFCTSLNDSPTSPEHLDILLTDLGEKYYVEVQSEKGKHLVETTKKLFAPVTEKDEKKKKDVEKQATDAIARHLKIKDVDVLVKKLDTIFDAPYWKSIAMKCLGCGVCTYLCPTCHCFDIHDETTSDKGARIRVWDSCMRSEYTLHASGHNPRPERMNRIRNRVYHKYNYYPKNHQVIACVGCGRCIDNCPVNIDIIDVVTKTEGVKP
ncbi:MAG: 4Fe-4S dicluster domain-containing protein [Methanobacteriota archaeon]